VLIGELKFWFKLSSLEIGHSICFVFGGFDLDDYGLTASKETDF